MPPFDSVYLLFVVISALLFFFLVWGCCSGPFCIIDSTCIMKPFSLCLCPSGCLSSRLQTDQKDTMLRPDGRQGSGPYGRGGGQTGELRVNNCHTTVLIRLCQLCANLCVFGETLGFWFDLPVCSHWLYIFSFFCSASPSMWPRCRWPRTWWIWSTATAAWRKTRTTPSSTEQTRVRSPGFLLTIKGQNDSKPLFLIVRDLFVPPRCHFTKCPSWYSWRVSEPWRSQWVLKILL